MAFTKADQAREIGFAWLNGAEAAQQDRDKGIQPSTQYDRAVVQADRTGYADGSSNYAAFVAGYKYDVASQPVVESADVLLDKSKWVGADSETITEPDDEGLTEEERDEVLRNDPNWKSEEGSYIVALDVAGFACHGQHAKEWAVLASVDGAVIKDGFPTFDAAEQWLNSQS